MAESSKAVFLSYASQDAEAARRICEALRAAGVEVWFDQSELRGGDAWDQKIRRQIKECALFVPIISANTQARAEGYFRREWKLAAERTHDMADHVAFLLPVVIDTTHDRAAHVPEKFREVQWSRLANDGAVAAFCDRVRALLSSGTRNDIATGTTPAPSSSAKRFPLRGRAAGWGALGVTALVVAVALAVFRSWGERRADEGRLASPPANPPLVKPTSPAREWITKARALFEPWDLATQEDFKQAEQFLQRALDLDPSEAEAWAARAILQCGFIVIPHDPAEERRRAARADADRAVKLAPDSDYAQFALAYAMRLERETVGEGIRILRELVQRHPDDRFMLRTLGAPLSRSPATAEEGLGLLARAAALPGGDPIAEYVQGESLRRYLGRVDDALAAFDRALALAPNFAEPHCEKIITLLESIGDAEAARAALEKVPLVLWREDRVMTVAVWVWFAVDEPERVLQALAPAGSYLAGGFYVGPTGYLRGLAHRRAGRLAAAQVEWRAALQLVQQRLEASPTNHLEQLWKARILGALGDAAGARSAVDLFRQLSSARGVATAERFGPILVQALTGTADELFALAERLLGTSGRDQRLAAAAILFHPELDPFRRDPRFPALAAKAKAYFAGQHAARAGKP